MKIIWLLPANDVIPLNSEDGSFFLNVIWYPWHMDNSKVSKLCRVSGPNKMAPLASILWERE